MHRASKWRIGSWPDNISSLSFMRSKIPIFIFQISNRPFIITHTSLLRLHCVVRFPTSWGVGPLKIYCTFTLIQPFTTPNTFCAPLLAFFDILYLLTATDRCDFCTIIMRPSDRALDWAIGTKNGCLLTKILQRMCKCGVLMRGRRVPPRRGTNLCMSIGTYLAQLRRLVNGNWHESHTPCKHTSWAI